MKMIQLIMYNNMNATVKYKTKTLREMEVSLILSQEEALYLKILLCDISKSGESGSDIANDIFHMLPSPEVLNEDLNK